MKIALTGATGFVGRHVLPQLLSEGHTVRALCRGRRPAADSRVTPVEGDLFTPAALRELMAGADAVVHLVGIIMERPGRGQTFARVHVEGTRNLIKAAQAACVKRWVHMSALGSRPDGVSTYHRTKWQAEEAVRAAGLDYTIFRPSLIHGPDGEFVQMVKDFCCGMLPPTPPFIPYFGTGHGVSDLLWLVKAGLWPFRGVGQPPYVARCQAGRLQPVWVQDVARVFAAAPNHPASVGETYPVGGPDVLTWPGLYETCHRHIPGALAKPILALPVPVAKLMARLPGVPFNLDQVIMSQEDSVCDTSKLTAEFGLSLAPFEPTFASYATQIE